MMLEKHTAGTRIRIFSFSHDIFYNELQFCSFPKMGDFWIPPEIIDPSLYPKWRNFFENTATVQFDHRILAMGTLASVSYQYAKARLALNGSFWKALPNYSRIAFNSVAAMSAIQVTLGISTLLLYVPIPLAAAHQAGSLLLLTCLSCLAHSFRFSRFSAIAGISSSMKFANVFPKA
jgi:heme a synthase